MIENKKPARADVVVEIEAERIRQMTQEGYSATDDDEHNPGGELALASAAYAVGAGCAELIASVFPVNRDIGLHMKRQALALFPWPHRNYKPKTKRQDLIRSLALGMAEVERLDRLAAKEVA